MLQVNSLVTGMKIKSTLVPGRALTVTLTTMLIKCKIFSIDYFLMFGLEKVMFTVADYLHCSWEITYGCYIFQTLRSLVCACRVIMCSLQFTSDDGIPRTLDPKDRSSKISRNSVSIYITKYLHYLGQFQIAKDMFGIPLTKF